MKWIVENEDGTYRLGLNMKMEIGSDGVIPNPDKAGLFEDLKEGEDAAFFKKVVHDDIEYY